ncbi:MAG TPA: A24 family peptidase, partial [Anaerolineae bacterium]|nr:A24 family peptidase [Anaerolineae bacterium]
RHESFLQPVGACPIVQFPFVFVKSMWYNPLQLAPVGYRVVVLYALLGLCVGAFLNLTADNLPRRRSVLSPPRCPSCGARAAWGDAVWLLSLPASRGRCRQCGTRYPLRRPVLELVTILAFAFLWLRYGPSVQLALVTLYASVLFLIFVIDLEHRLILRVVIYPAIALAIAGSILYPGMGLRRALLGGALAFSFFYVVEVLGRLVFKRPAMGRGDVNLAAFVGLITGFPEVIMTLVIAVSLGGLVSLVLVLSRARGLQSYIPYGVFLVAAGLVVLVFGGEIIGWYFGLY